MPGRSWVETVKPYLGHHYELDRLWRKHAELEARLAELDRIKWLTPEQEFERKRLQKEKLAGKDRMLAIARELAATTSGG